MVKSLIFIILHNFSIGFEAVLRINFVLTKRKSVDYNLEE